jgi:glycosyltransferase involved in cell wall biosynthesis
MTANGDVAPAAGGSGSHSRAESIRWQWTTGHLRRTFYSLLQFQRERAWGREVGRIGRSLVESQTYGAVITCGPPHLVHDTGRRFATAAGVPFVMDLRDPWSLVERVADPMGSPAWFALAARYERRCVAEAALVIMNTDRARDAMRAAHPAHAARVVTVMNGWDDDATATAPRERTFTVAFAGSISLDRDPSVLLRASAALVQRLKLLPDDFRVVFAGETGAESDPAGPAALATRLGIRAHVRIVGFRPRAEVTALLASADVLVSLYQDSTLAVPSKVFEYLNQPGRILAFAEPDSATAAVLAGLDADVVSPGDVDATIAALERRYRAFTERRAPPAPLRPAHLSRAANAGVLLGHLERITKAGVARIRPASAEPVGSPS